MLEGHAAAQAAERLTPEMLAELHRNVAAINAAIDRPLPDVMSSWRYPPSSTR